jgi:septal ring factor EnvC (AmiA/AmiB activator)
MLALLLFALPALAAQSSGMEEKSKQELQDTLEKIRASQAHSGALKQQAGKLEKQLAASARESARMAAGIQAQERLLTDQETKLKALEAQKQAKEKTLQARKAQMEQTLSAMIRLSGAPKEAVIAQPGSLDRTLKTAEALGVVTEALRAAAADLRNQLAALDALQKQIEQRRADAEKHQRDLAAQQQKLAAHIRDNRRLRDKLYSEQQQESEAIAQLSKKSRSLQDLIGTLENARRVQERMERNRKEYRFAHESAPAHAPSSAPAGASHLRLPAAGSIVRHFGERGSHGLLIETRENAEVVAPAAGEVVFTGPFMDYGLIVIIRHAKDLHSLLAGFDHIDVSPGDTVNAGEPIGRMGAKNTGNQLYLELRKNEHPVDPAPWLK